MFFYSRLNSCTVHSHFRIKSISVNKCLSRPLAATPSQSPLSAIAMVGFCPQPPITPPSRHRSLSLGAAQGPHLKVRMWLVKSFWVPVRPLFEISSFLPLTFPTDRASPPHKAHFSVAKKSRTGFFPLQQVFEPHEEKTCWRV